MATRIVRLPQKEFCSCLSKNVCQHIVALKISLAMEVPAAQIWTTYNLAVLRANHANGIPEGKKQKTTKTNRQNKQPPPPPQKKKKKKKKTTKKH